jgi:hypothetical protein
VTDATIRADKYNSGLRYYKGLGFVDYDRLMDIPPRDGTRVDRIRKRLILTDPVIAAWNISRTMSDMLLHP